MCAEKGGASVLMAGYTLQECQCIAYSIRSMRF